MRICLIGDLQDLLTAYIGWLAERRGFDVIRLGEDELGDTWSFAFNDCDLDNAYVETADRRIAFSELDGAYVRMNPQPGLPANLQLPPDEERAFAMERRGAIYYLINNLPCLVANRPTSGRSNGAKPFQMRSLALAGFAVPRWIVTNEAGSAEEFITSCSDGAIYKSCSGLRSRVRTVDDALMSRLYAGTTPVIIQEYIAGHDVRGHAIRDHMFPTKVISDGIDYRFEHEGNKYEATTLPPAIAELCQKVAAQEGLLLAGFDFRVTDADRWHCLEVNPVPTFLPYEMSTGQPIGNTLLDAFIDNIVRA